MTRTTCNKPRNSPMTLRRFHAKQRPGTSLSCHGPYVTAQAAEDLPLSPGGGSRTAQLRTRRHCRRQLEGKNIFGKLVVLQTRLDIESSPAPHRRTGGGNFRGEKYTVENFNIYNPNSNLALSIRHLFQMS